MAFERDEEIREQFAEVPPHRLPDREPWEKVLPPNGRRWHTGPGWPRVIGITGRKRSGKNTAAEGLVERGYEVVGFADPLKEAALDLNPLISAGVRLRPIVDHFGWEKAKDQWPEVRRTLQALGTDVIRARDPEFWVNAFLTRTAGRQVVVADVRFDNEAQVIHRLGGIVVEVIRPSLDDDGDTHASEAGVNAALIDLVLLNADSVQAMQRRLVRGLDRMYHNNENP